MTHIIVLNVDKHYIGVNKMSDKNYSNCICSRIGYGFRTGWKYLYCMLDEQSIWRGGKPVDGSYVCKHWRNTK